MTTTRTNIVWPNVVLLLMYHIISLQGLYYILTLRAQWKTVLCGWFIWYISILGITMGTHRLWCHRTYKAKLPLKILLCAFQTMAFQNCIYVWTRDHRVHHKYTDTDADPHNINRGFFFAHMGWLMVRKHPDVIAKGQSLDMCDLEADPVVVFQRKYYGILGPISCLVVPTLVPWYFWKEDFYISFAVRILYYVCSLHVIWLVNSVAHMWGDKPYDRCIKPADNNLVASLSLGEAWHNYHHTFPWDYKAAELDKYSGNMTTASIDLMVWIGWAYDLKVATPAMIRRKIQETRELRLAH